MNDDDPILTELRKISAWADMQRKMTRGVLVFLAVFIPALIIFGVVMEHHLTTTLEDAKPEQKQDWYDVDRDVREGDFDKAIRIGEQLILKTPQYPEAHRRLAGAYLAAGNIQKAREHYEEAFRLFPSEENEKLVMAIVKRSKAETNRTSETAGPGP